MSRYEFLKTFQYSRLPFILHEKGNLDLPVNTLVSTKIKSNTNRPYMSTMYYHEGNPLHKFKELRPY